MEPFPDDSLLNKRTSDQPYNWLGFWVNFPFGVLLGVGLWRYGIARFLDGELVHSAPGICLATGFALIVGVIAGALRDRLWEKLVYLPVPKSLYRSTSD